MLEIIAKTETIENGEAGVRGSLHFENDSILDERVQMAAEIEATLRALKANYRKEFLLAVSAVVGGDEE